MTLPKPCPIIITAVTMASCAMASASLADDVRDRSDRVLRPGSSTTARMQLAQSESAQS